MQRQMSVGFVTADEARLFLERERKRQLRRARLARSIQLGSLFGFITAIVLAIFHVIPILVMQLWQVVNYLLGILTTQLFRTNPRRSAALAALLPHAELRDLGYLIEGLDYFRRDLLCAKLTELLPEIRASDTALFPKAARKILSQHILNEHAGATFRLLLLKTLLCIGDPNASKLVQRLAKSAPQMPGDERLIGFAQTTLGQSITVSAPEFATRAEVLDALKTKISYRRRCAALALARVAHREDTALLVEAFGYVTDRESRAVLRQAVLPYLSQITPDDRVYFSSAARQRLREIQENAEIDPEFAHVATHALQQFEV